MATFDLTWDAVLLDTTGEPVVISNYNVYVDSVFAVDTGGAPFANNVVINGTGPHVVEVAAVGPGGEGLKLQLPDAIVPSGIPAAPTNGATTRD